MSICDLDQDRADIILSGIVAARVFPQRDNAVVEESETVVIRPCQRKDLLSVLVLLLCLSSH